MRGIVILLACCLLFLEPAKTQAQDKQDQQQRDIQELIAAIETFEKAGWVDRNSPGIVDRIWCLKKSLKGEPLDDSELIFLGRKPVSATSLVVLDDTLGNALGNVAGEVLKAECEVMGQVFQRAKYPLQVDPSAGGLRRGQARRWDRQARRGK